MQDNVVTLLPVATVAESLTIIDEKNIRVLPIMTADRRCTGLVSVFKMGKYFFPSPNRLFDSRRVNASVRNIARTLGGQMVFSVHTDSEEELILMIGAMNVDSFAARLPK